MIISPRAYKKLYPHNKKPKIPSNLPITHSNPKPRAGRT
jgi:hypothetical protein